MGLFGRRRDIYDASHGEDPGAAVEAGFAPRTDGDYLAGELILRFARPVVTETDAAQQDVARGEFTDGGRFTVTRPFGRPIVYTVLAVDDDGAPLRVRRTDTATRVSTELDLAFDPD